MRSTRFQFLTKNKLFRRYADYFAPLVIATAWADRMRKTHLTAITTLGQIGSFEGVMGSASITPTFGYFSLWKWGHAKNSCLRCLIIAFILLPIAEEL